MRLGSAGDPLRWYISHPAKWGPLTSHFSRLPSADRINAPFLVPTNTRTLLILFSLLCLPQAGEASPRGASSLARLIKSCDVKFHARILTQVLSPHDSGKVYSKVYRCCPSTILGW